MLSRFAVALLFLAALPLEAQVQPAATGESAASDEDLRMTLPPPVSGVPYPRVTGDEVRSNYLRGSVAFDAAYVDNAFSGEFPRPQHETTLTVRPAISFNRTSPRQSATLSYSPGFTFYRPTSELDAIDQNADVAFLYRFARYTALNVTNSFLQSTNIFGQAGAAYGGGVTGAAGNEQILIVPFAEQISDTLHATFSHQYARNQMFGVGGFFGMLNYPNASQSPGLFNSKSGGGSGFYAYRVASRHYLGVTYEYTRIVASPPGGDSVTSMQSILPYYTFYLSPAISVSLAGGPQYFKVSQPGVADSSAWTPVATASVGRQSERTNLALSYSRTVTGGGGLLGAYKQDSAALSARARLTRSWTVGADGSYGNISAATSGLVVTTESGHRISGKGLMQRTFGEHFNVELGYERLHQTYRGISLLSTSPDTNRGYASLNYQFARPIGR
jgi:hypothetical protein